eukprot:2685369-Pleurochrysis_carterae.AAC.1
MQQKDDASFCSASAIRYQITLLSATSRASHTRDHRLREVMTSSATSSPQPTKEHIHVTSSRMRRVEK